MKPLNPRSPDRLAGGGLGDSPALGPAPSSPCAGARPQASASGPACRRRGNRGPLPGRRGRFLRRSQGRPASLLTASAAPTLGRPGAAGPGRGRAGGRPPTDLTEPAPAAAKVPGPEQGAVEYLPLRARSPVAAWHAGRAALLLHFGLRRRHLGRRFDPCRHFLRVWALCEGAGCEPLRLRAHVTRRDQ